MNPKIKAGDYVWYHDFCHQVIEVRGKRALIREVDVSASLNDLDEWVPLADLELDDLDEDDDWNPADDPNYQEYED